MDEDKVFDFLNDECLERSIGNWERFSNYTAPHLAYWLVSIIPNMEEINGENAFNYIMKEYCNNEKFDYTLYKLAVNAFKILALKEKNEYSVHTLFKENYSKIYEGEVIYHKNDPRHIPDAWVEKDGERIPVEMKRHCFDKKALEQLTRYINFYNCRHGIAVGEELTVELPDNISFVSIDSLGGL